MRITPSSEYIPSVGATINVAVNACTGWSGGTYPSYYHYVTTSTKVRILFDPQVFEVVGGAAGLHVTRYSNMGLEKVDYSPGKLEFVLKTKYSFPVSLVGDVTTFTLKALNVSAGKSPVTLDPAFTTYDPPIGGLQLYNAGYAVADTLPRYTLQTTATMNRRVVVSPGPDSDGKYAAGTVVTLSKDGITDNYVYFYGWAGDVSGHYSTVTLTMNSNKRAKAYYCSIFNPLLRPNIQAAPPEGGTVTIDPPPELEDVYFYGTRLALTAHPSAGYYVAWSGAISGTANPAAATATNQLITANFFRLDPFDPGDDSFAHATVLSPPAPGEQTHPNHVVCDPDRFDWYKVPLTAGVQVNFNTAGGSGDIFAEVISDRGVFLASDDNGTTNGQFSLNFTPFTTGNYYLRVRGKAFGNLCRYDLKYRAVTPAAGLDPWDPMNDSWAAPTVLANAAATEQSVGPFSLSSADAYDWFRIGLTAGQRVNFNSAGGTGDVCVDLFNDKGDLIASDDNSAGSGQFSLSYTPIVSGNYLLRVRAKTLGGICAYFLNSSVVPPLPGPDPWDPVDNSWATPNVLVPATADLRSVGPLTLSSTDSYDWFKIYLTAGVRVNFNTSGGSGDNYADLITNQGVFVASDDNGTTNGQFSLTYTPVVSGYYLLRVRAKTPGAACAYSLRYNTIKPAANEDPWDPRDNSWATATLLPNPTTTCVKYGLFTLGVDDAYDWFKIRLNAGETLSMLTSAHVVYIRFDLLMASTGTVVATSAAENYTVSRITYTAPSSGYYYARVRKRAYQSELDDYSLSGCLTGAQ